MNLKVIKTVVYVLAVLIVLALIGVGYGIYLKVNEGTSRSGAQQLSSQQGSTGATAGGAQVDSLFLPDGCTNATVIQTAGQILLQFTGASCSASYQITTDGGRWLTGEPVPPAN